MKSVQIRSFFFFVFSRIRTECGKILREKCPNTELFLVRIYTYLDWIRRYTEYLSVFSPNVGKYGPEKTPYLDTFQTVRNFLEHAFFSSWYPSQKFLFMIQEIDFHFRFKKFLHHSKKGFQSWFKENILTCDFKNRFSPVIQNISTVTVSDIQQ